LPGWKNETLQIAVVEPLREPHPVVGRHGLLAEDSQVVTVQGVQPPQAFDESVSGDAETHYDKTLARVAHFSAQSDRAGSRIRRVGRPMA